MTVLHLFREGGYLHFGLDQCKQTGAHLADSYRSADPFPSIVMDDFLDADVLRQVLDEFPGRDGVPYFDRAQERLKFQFGPDRFNGPVTRNLLAELNSKPFLAFLSEMTGIPGLIPDPYFTGGGLHETLAGGHLSVHADFNVHGRMQVERRLNLLVYLNDDWQEAYGGHLELWDKKMRAPVRSILPILGRAVIFSTDADSFHGQPEPVRCPPDRSRRSIATYYYTAFPSDSIVTPRTTVFKVRPGSTDQTDWKVRYKHFVADWVPPKLQNVARRLVH